MENRTQQVMLAVCLFIQALHAHLAFEVGGLIFGPFTKNACEIALLQLIPGILTDLFHRKVLAPAAKRRKPLSEACKQIMAYFYILIVTEIAFGIFGSPFSENVTEFIARITMVINSFIAFYLLIHLDLNKPRKNNRKGPVNEH